LWLANIKDAYEHGKLDDVRLNKSVDKSNMLIQKMSSTIDDFRNFFNIDKERTYFNVEKSVNDVLDILEGSLNEYSITVDRVFNNRSDIYGFANEYSQVLLNIFKNAIDALVEKSIDSPVIEVRESIVDDKYILTIGDNAGGIPKDLIDRIFEPYFTTKIQNDGTGIGLYMSKIIIEDHMDGELSVYNGEKGAIFEVSIKIHLRCDL